MTPDSGCVFITHSKCVLRLALCVALACLIITLTGVNGLVKIRLYRLGILFSPGKLVTRGVGDLKTPEA